MHEQEKMYAFVGRKMFSLHLKVIFLLALRKRQDVRIHIFSEVRDHKHYLEQCLQLAVGLPLSWRFFFSFLRCFRSACTGFTLDIGLPRTVGNLFVKQVEATVILAANAGYDLTNCSKIRLFLYICFSLTFGQMPSSQLHSTLLRHWPGTTASSALVFHDLV